MNQQPMTSPSQAGLSIEELERLAYAMAQAIPDLDCPDCCECGWTYQYMEYSAQLYRDELEWACLALVLCSKKTGQQGRGQH